MRKLYFDTKNGSSINWPKLFKVRHCHCSVPARSSSDQFLNNFGYSKLIPKTKQ